MKKSLLDKMRDQINRSGSSKKEILYFTKDTVKRVRFLHELDTGFSFQFHNEYDLKIMELCKDPDDHENCKMCEDGVYIQENFVWCVWDYDTSSVKLLQFKATGISPVPSFMEYYEEYGTLTDRDYKIKKVGSGQGGSFAITPLDKERFKNAKAKPLSRKQVEEILSKAWPCKDETPADEADEDEADEDEAPAKKGKGKASGKAEKKSAKKKKEPTIHELYEELTMSQLKEICIEIGMSKKEIKAFEDEAEIIEELFGNYEEEDLQELVEGLEEADEDE